MIRNELHKNKNNWYEARRTINICRQQHTHRNCHGVYHKTREKKSIWRLSEELNISGHHIVRNNTIPLYLKLKIKMDKIKRVLIIMSQRRQD